MKKTATLTILAAMVMMTALSCTKELNGVVDKSGDTMSLTVSATLPDYADATKNTLVNTVRVKWETGDEVYVYDNVKCLGTLTATVSDDQGKTALLSGTISTSEASNLTLVAVSGDITPSVNEKDDDVPAGGITFDLSSQSLPGAPYVAFATVDTQSGTVSNLSAAFTFATSVERVNCTGLRASTTIDYVAIMGVNTKLTIKPNTDAAPDVTAEKGRGTINRTNADGFGNVTGEGIMTFSVALLAQEAASRSIYAVQDANRVTEAKFTNGGLLKSGLSYNTVTQLADAEDYVLIKAKYNGTDSTTLKWYKQNLAITASGKKAWKGTNPSAVKVPGTNGEEVIVGDYFQWAASYAGYSITDEDKKKPENLLIYTAFTNTGCGESESKFTFIGSKQFNQANAPYSSGSGYDNTYSGSGKQTLDTTSGDDVANIILGGDWRMPTSAEFNAMKAATYWAWDGTDQGYYVFWPGQGTNGTAGGREAITDTDTKAAALLFFSAAGRGNVTSLFDAGSFGVYWSSSLNTDNTDNAYRLRFYSDAVYPQSTTDRCNGFSVRPVSD